MARQYGYSSRLTVASPTVAEEWDYDKNPSRLFPTILPTGSLRPVWWKCSVCSHSYKASPESRTVRGKGCPECEKNKLVRRRINAEDDEDILPGEKNPKLKAIATGKSMFFQKK